MDVTKAPPVDPGMSQGSAASSQPQLQTQLQPQLQQPPLAGSLPAAAPQDRVDIQPLDLVGALLILIAEVRTALPAAGSPAAGFTPPLGAQLPGLTGQGALGQIPSLAPQMLLHLFLQALPEELPVAETLPVDAALTSPAPDTTAWSAKAAQLESALSAALDTGVAAVTAWHDVPPPVVAAVDYARTVVLAVLGGESFNAEWLRPEWLGLAPRLERYWRRRRAGRRGLSNPDHGRETTHRDGRTDERDSS